MIGARQLAFFLDLDGTLAPLAARPELVELPAATREIVSRLLRRHVVCVISGRGLSDLRRVVGLSQAFYAANHGHQIVGPPGSGVALEMGAEQRGELRAAAIELESALRFVDGVVIEEKGLSVAVHYRLVEASQRSSVDRIAKAVAGRFPSLRPMEGTLSYELLPPGTCDKGFATKWLLEHLSRGTGEICPVCIGDDLTDEDMFAAIEGRGVSVVVGGPDRATRADYWLRDGGEVASFLEVFAVDPSR